ncbi:MAG: hypothetical protein KGN84_07615 [Acidobacteriota bacterium]|nr:hypothetical protein [Acidobacteriota bacterium]
MNPDQNLIQSAYQETIQKLFSQLFDGYVTAAGDAGQRQQAEQNFMNGVRTARQTRDRAVALLA